MRRELIVAIVSSLILHVLLVFILNNASNLLSPPDASVLEVFLERPDGGWQLADIPEPSQQVKPDKSEFLGMYNQSVKEETVAVARVENRRHKAEARGTHKTGDLYKIDKNLFAMNEVSTGSPAAPESGFPEEFYPDFKYGEHTYLNVLRYPDVEYFVRLKRIFKVTWDPISVLKREMTTVSRGAVSVVLAVTIDKMGELAELFVLKGSGIAGYDDEAMRTIRASSPFAGPPEKFLDKDDTLRMSWTFVVYL